MTLTELSPQQRRFAELTARGLGAPDIARKMGLSHKRVRQCLIDLYRLLELGSRTDLAWWWWQREGKAALTPDARELARQLLADLSPAERALARLVAERRSTRDIAERLHISERTVRNRCSEVCQLLDLPGRLALARLVWEADG